MLETQRRRVPRPRRLRDECRGDESVAGLPGHRSRSVRGAVAELAGKARAVQRWRVAATGCVRRGPMHESAPTLVLSVLRQELIASSTSTLLQLIPSASPLARVGPRCDI